MATLALLWLIQSLSWARVDICCLEYLTFSHNIRLWSSADLGHTHPVVCAHILLEDSGDTSRGSQTRQAGRDRCRQFVDNMHEIAQLGDNIYEIAQVGVDMHGIAKNLIENCRVRGRCEVEVCGWGVTVGIQTDNVASCFYGKIKWEFYEAIRSSKQWAPWFIQANFHFKPIKL